MGMGGGGASPPPQGGPSWGLIVSLLAYFPDIYIKQLLRAKHCGNLEGARQSPHPQEADSSSREIDRHIDSFSKEERRKFEE